MRLGWGQLFSKWVEDYANESQKEFKKLFGKK